MNNKSLLSLKRTANQITQEEDINPSSNVLIDLARKIFAHHVCQKYVEQGLCLYQTGEYKHNNQKVEPHFVRDDGVIIFLQLKQNNKYLNTVSNEYINLAMDILKMDTVKLFTIVLNPDVDYRSLSTINNTHYTTITEEKVNYSENSVGPSQNTKKQKLDGTETKNPPAHDRNEPPKPFVSHEWISASKTRNYALRNTLVDWLDYWYDKSAESKVLSRPNPGNSEFNFGKFIMSKGIQFENEVIKLIKNKLKPEEFTTICHNFNNFYDHILEYEQQTIQEIKKGTPVIYQGLLMNRSGNIAYSYGMPDLIIRSDYISKIIKNNPLNDDMIKFAAPNLNGNYHYVIIDIKFTTLELCSDGIRIRNSGSIPAYKCQLYIYTHALGKIQGYEPKNAYILGRRYKFESKKMQYCMNDCFEMLGEIQYNSWDIDYITETEKSIDWINRLRTEGKEWKLLPEPSVPELYPNMSCTTESNWDQLKTQYAKQIGEITLLWNCGTKNREIAHENGVYCFTDPNCSSSTLGVNGPKIAPILDEIININRKRKFESNLDRISIHLNNESDNLWLEKTKMRITVDFETINCIFDDLSKLPKAQDYNYLFMIGITYKVKNEPPKYKMFLAAELSIDAEFQMVYQFHKFLRELTDIHLGKNYPIPSLLHWGHIERSFFDNLCKRLIKKIGADVEEDIDKIKKSLSWYDLCESFKENRITINGCFKYGLKEIAGRLTELNLIKSSWNKNSECMNGNAAMIMAKKAYDISQQTGVSIIQTKIMREIMEYNKIDCMVIQEIVDLLTELVNKKRKR